MIFSQPLSIWQVVGMIHADLKDRYRGLFLTLLHHQILTIALTYVKSWSNAKYFLKYQVQCIRTLFWSTFYVKRCYIAQNNATYVLMVRR